MYKIQQKRMPSRRTWETMKTKTKITITLSGFVLAGGLFAGYNIYKAVTKPEVVVKQVVDQRGEKEIEVIDSKSTNLEKEFPDDMTEEQVIEAIHKMSHQKVVADEKWGAIPLTQDRVKRLIKVIKAHQYENNLIFLSILERWEKGDFSQAYEDHNKMWNLLDGTRGKAVNNASPEEERKFIQEHFNAK
jgi:hypothetical protein